MTTMHDDDGHEYDDDENDGDNDDHDIYGYDELSLTSLTAGWTLAVSLALEDGTHHLHNSSKLCFDLVLNSRKYLSGTTPPK